MIEMDAIMMAVELTQSTQLPEWISIIPLCAAAVAAVLLISALLIKIADPFEEGCAAYGLPPIGRETIDEIMGHMMRFTNEE